MATKKRAQSESGFYHVFQRGVNHFDIFEDDDDRNYYIDKMKKAAAKLSVEIHAWCLMSNHTHLLVRAPLENLSAMMRQLGSVYARHFNTRHKRSGPLFGGRFCSVSVETDTQLLAVVRYIHRNPIHHDEQVLYGSYPWSSYKDYLSDATTFCKTSLVKSLSQNRDTFISLHEESSDDERHLDIDTIGPMGDEEARKRANRALARRGFNIDVSQIGTLSRNLRDIALSLVKRTVGCSIRQMQRLTAVAYSAIRDAIERSLESGTDIGTDKRPQNRLRPFSPGEVESGDSNETESEQHLDQSSTSVNTTPPPNPA